MTLRQTLLLGLTAAVVVALVPAGFALDRYLSSGLEAGVRSDLHRAPMLLEDRNTTRGDALMMHAREVAAAPELGAILARGAAGDAEGLLADVPPPGERPVAISAADGSWLGVRPPDGMLAATRRGEAPVSWVAAGERVWVVSVAPVEEAGRYVGAAGVAAPVDDAMAGTLAGLTGADVVITAGGRVVAGTAPTDLAAALTTVETAGEVVDVRVAGAPYWVVSSPLGDVATVVFAVNAARELAILPELRRGALIAGALALILSLVLAAVVATGVAGPVRGLAQAADRLAEGDFHAPLDRSRLEEVDRMARAFDGMRRALAARLAELSEANRELAERQDRLQALQSELIRRDRLAASSRLVTELAHEIRNPVANIRNCLEVVRRRMAEDPEGRRFADLAIDELLRMHELAEQMLDLNRPMDPGAARADPVEVANQVATLFRTGSRKGWSIELTADPATDVAMPPDTLKQILLSLVQNAREAMETGGVVRLVVTETEAGVRIRVEDQGPGIPESDLDRIFDPFFTTKGEVSGVGLGLFIAQGLATRFGGRLTAGNGEGGAVFTLDLPTADTTQRRVAAGAGDERA